MVKELINKGIKAIYISNDLYISIYFDGNTLYGPFSKQVMCNYFTYLASNALENGDITLMLFYLELASKLYKFSYIKG